MRVRGKGGKGKRISLARSGGANVYKPGGALPVGKAKGPKGLRIRRKRGWAV